MSKKHTLPKIGITIGDVNGIGPEVIINTLEDSRVYHHFTPIIYAHGGMLSFFRKTLGKDNFNFHQAHGFDNINPKKINVIKCWDEKVEVTPGKPNSASGIFAKKSLESAVSDLKAGLLDGLVTAPISKEFIQEQGFDFPGHTEYLAQAFEAKDHLMLMVHEGLRIGVATGHIPLNQVAGSLTKELIGGKINILYNCLTDDFEIKKPRIAVLGLNPHAGENGRMGTEEKEIITPLVEELKNEGKLVFGPYPADGFFGSDQFRSFDGILAMYHDQGLIPFKHISHGEGVNFTAGINAIRTSPAHGTAYNLAGKNQADPTSMRHAIYLAMDLVRKKIPEEENTL